MTRTLMDLLEGFCWMMGFIPAASGFFSPLFVTPTTSGAALDFRGIRRIF